MITTKMLWYTDISTAPRGEMVTTSYTIMVKGEPVERSRSDHVPTRIMALTNCGKVVSTYWLPPRLATCGAVLDGDRWSGFNRGSDPVMWAHWPDAGELIAATRPAQEAAQ